MALDAFYNQITSAPVKIALIGSGCSPATEPTAENSHYYNITQVRKYSLSAALNMHTVVQYKTCAVLTIICRFITIIQNVPSISHFLPCVQISCVTSSTELVNRVRFRYYFQMLPTDAELAPTYFSVIRQYRWRRVGLIVQNENLFTVVWSDSESFSLCFISGTMTLCKTN